MGVKRGSDVPEAEKEECSEGEEGRQFPGGLRSMVVHSGDLGSALGWEAGGRFWVEDRLAETSQVSGVSHDPPKEPGAKQVDTASWVVQEFSPRWEMGMPHCVLVRGKDSTPSLSISWCWLRAS